MSPLNLLRQIVLAVIAAITAAELEADGEGGGALKRAQALRIVEELLEPLLPGWAEPMALMVAGYLIDAFVAYWNRQGWTAGDIADREDAPIPPVAPRLEP